jgi:predicted DNA-binding transcriptional regulator AlpA
VDLEIGRLPQPIKMGRRSYWREHEVDQHIQNLQVAQND